MGVQGIYTSWGFVFVNPFWFILQQGLCQQLSLTVQKRESCNWWCPWELFLLSVYVCAHKRECLLSCAKSGFNPALSFSSSYVFPSAATFQVFGTGLAEGIFQRSGRSDGRAQLWRHGGNGTTASHWAFCLCQRAPAEKLWWVLMRQLERPQLPCLHSGLPFLHQLAQFWYRT